MITDIFLSLLISLVINLVFFFLATVFKTDKVTDFSYGISFVVIVWFMLLRNGFFNPLQLIVVGLVTLWGLRLALYLVVRILKTKRDKRFDGVRENFFKFFKFWTFQALSVWIILLPSIIFMSKNNIKINPLSFIGILIWVGGFLTEAISDQQKFNFKNVNPNDFITSGIWRYSRHPNYFGEALLWWGIFVVVLPYISGAQYLVIAGPIVITCLLLFISGIPLLEKSYDKRYGSNDKYLNYKRKTSIFVPLPPKN